MPLSTGDGLSKALSRKRPVKQLAAYAEEFFAGAASLGRDLETTKQVWHMVMSFAGYSFCKGHSCSYIQVAQQSAYLRAHYPAEFFAAVLGNGGGFYAPFAYVAEARRAGVTLHPPDVNRSDFRTTGNGSTIQIGFQFIKGLSTDAVDRILEARAFVLDGNALPTYHPTDLPPFSSLDDFRTRTQLRPDDLRLLIKVGALDSIAGGLTRPMLLWEADKEVGRYEGKPVSDLLTGLPSYPPTLLPSYPPTPLPPYPPSRRRQEELALLGFSTDCHPMELQQERLRRFRLCPATALDQHVGRHVLCCGMLTTAKPVHTAKDEPMQFATFDDGHGLIETVLFPDLHRSRGHVLFDQGPFIFRGRVEQEFGAISVTVTHLDRVERMLAKLQGVP
jgi:DNA polymerase III alpha subunit